MYYAFNYTQNAKLIKDKAQPLLTIQELKQVGFPDFTSKIELIPYNRSQIYIRVDNLDDKFDLRIGFEKNITYLNLNHLATLLYFKVNGKNLTEKLYKYIAEMSLSGG